MDNESLIEQPLDATGQAALHEKLKFSPIIILATDFSHQVPGFFSSPACTSKRVVAGYSRFRQWSH